VRFGPASFDCSTVRLRPRLAFSRHAPEQVRRSRPRRPEPPGISRTFASVAAGVLSVGRPLVTPFLSAGLESEWFVAAVALPPIGKLETTHTIAQGPLAVRQGCLTSKHVLAASSVFRSSNSGSAAGSVRRTDSRRYPDRRRTSRLVAGCGLSPGCIAVRVVHDGGAACYDWTPLTK
jgi:hypothetical protein